MSQEELIVEPRFKEQFQIAHSTDRYQGFLAVLPAEFVGTAEHLTLIVETISQAAAEAFQEQGMAVPPWRRAAATLSKWALVRYFFHQTHQACDSHLKSLAMLSSVAILHTARPPQAHHSTSFQW